MTVPSVRMDEFLDRGNQITESVGATARICAQFLPKYELPPDTKSVTSTRINRATLELDDVTTIPLTEIRVRFTLDWQQLSTTDLATPLYIVQKHAQAYCRLEDRLLLLGLGAGQNQLNFGRAAGVPLVEVERGLPNLGLLGADAGVGDPNDIYTGIATAHSILEDLAVVGPWAIVMGDMLFDRADRMEQGFVDSSLKRIEHLLGTKVYRTTILPHWRAIVMGGAAASDNLSRSSEPLAPVDRAVALEPQLRYLRTDDNGRYEFAIVGNLALRVRDKDGIRQVTFGQ